MKMQLKLFVLGSSDILVMIVAFTRLRSIWKIEQFSKTVNMFKAMRFKRKSKSSSQYKDLGLILCAFVASVCLHLPQFFIDADNKECSLYLKSGETKAINGSHNTDKEENNNVLCSVYLMVYLMLLRYIPTALIALANLVIAWKLICIMNHQKALQKAFVEQNHPRSRSKNILHKKLPVTNT